MEDATMEEKKTVDASPPPPSSSHDKNVKVKQQPPPQPQQQDTTHNKTLVPSSSTLAASCDTMLLDSMDQCVGYVEDVDGQQRFDEAMTMTTNMRLGKNKQSSETKTPPEDSHNNNNNNHNNMLMTAVCGTDMEDLLVASALFLATSPTDTTLPTTTTFQGPKNKGTTHCRQRSLVDGDGGGGGCCMICHQLPQPPPPPSSNSTTEEQSDGQVVGVYELPCCGNHQCWNCVTILTLPVNNKEFRIGMCPHCRTWLQIMNEKTIQLLPETTTTTTTTTTTCSHCCQVKQPLIPDVDNIVTTLPMTSVLDDEDEPDNNAKDIIKETKTKTKLVALCDACCLAKHAPLIYECQTCHVSQRIAAPLYRCQPTPLEFFTQDHQQQLFGPCQNCAHTHDHGHSAEDTHAEEENLTSPKKTEEKDATTTTATTTGWRLRFDQILAIRAHDVPLAWGNDVAWRVAQLRVLAVQQGLLALDLDNHYDTTKTTTDDEDHQKAMTLESLISSLLLSSTSQHKNQGNTSPTNDHHHPASQQDAPSNDPAATSRTTDSPMKKNPSSSPQLDGGQQDPSSQTDAAATLSSGNDDCIIL